jgi:hypothetical protein
MYTYPDGTPCPIRGTTDDPYCATHDTTKPRRRKIEELKVVDYLRKTKDETLATFIHNKRENVESSGFRTLYFFPDILWELETYFVHLEIDEMQHKKYNCECKRILELNQCRGFKPTLLIRYNPNAVHIDGSKWKTSANKRLQELVRVLKWGFSDAGKLFANTIWKNSEDSIVPCIAIIYLYYDDIFCKDEKGVWPGQVRRLGATLDNNYFSEQINFIV